MRYEYDGKVYRVPFGFWWKYGRRKFKRRIRHALLFPFAWLGILVGVAVLSSLPYRVLLAVCDFISFFYYLCDRDGRHTAVKNLAIMFPKFGIRHSASNLIIRRSYRNMSRSVGYAFWTFRRARQRCARAGELSVATQAFLSANRPAVTVSAHLGCWEILSQLALLAGHRMMSVAKDIGSPGMTRMLMRARCSIGQEIVHANGAFKPLMAGIRAGKSIGLLVDQVVEPIEGGAQVKFFGRDYWVSPAPAFFAAKAKAPIVVAWSRPLADGRYRCETIDTIAAEEARNIKEVTQRISTALEGIIRRHPSCWPLNYDYFQPVWSVEREKREKERFVKKLEGLAQDSATGELKHD